MAPIRRYHYQNGLYFITCVTYKRQPILLEYPDYFLIAWKTVKPDAWVVMPDHFHVIIGVGEHTISDLMHNFKITYSKWYRLSTGDGKVWQDRFHDHIIRDERDLANHVNYIHFNPVHHGKEEDPFLWPHSSIHTYYGEGFYPRDWGCGEAMSFAGTFGEDLGDLAG